MRELLFIVALFSAVNMTRAAESPALKTNSLVIGQPGTLEILSPKDWTFSYTNLNLPDRALTIELHSASNSLVIRFYIRWDGFRGSSLKPNEADMSKIVSNNVVAQYLPVAVEDTVTLEKLHGPAVVGAFARITDRTWTPMVKDTYPNLTEGMFRCENIWGNFNIVTFGKDGPLFKDALKVLESMRRKP